MHQYVMAAAGRHQPHWQHVHVRSQHFASSRLVRAAHIAWLLQASAGGEAAAARLQAEVQREQERGAQLLEHHTTLRHQLEAVHRCVLHACKEHACTLHV